MQYLVTGHSSYTVRPEVQDNHPFMVIVVFRGNEILVARTYADVGQLTEICQDFCAKIKHSFSDTFEVFYQVENRFYVGPRTVIFNHKRFSNRFNTWLNRWKGKDALVTIKGAKVLSDTVVFMVDGVHLNDEG